MGYDFRARFHLGLDSVPAVVGWGEAVRLVRVLLTDPSSATCAAVEGWRHPMSREALLLADLFDLQYASKAKKKPQPYPRPWPDPSERRRIGRTSLSSERVRAILREARHGREEAPSD